MTESPPTLASLRSLPLKEQVIRELTRLIEDGSTPPGARLPGERALAERLQVSRGTVREAVQFLEALGVLEIRHGSGTYVRDAASGGSELSEQWRAWTRRHSARVRDLLEVRGALESHAVELAAERATPEARERIRDALDQMRSASEGDDVPLLVQADVAFHRAIVEAAGNVALAELAGALGAELIQERAATWDIPGRPARSLAEHREIQEAIERRDGEAARAAVLAHVASIERDVDGLVASAPAAEQPAATHAPERTTATRRTRHGS